MTGEPSNEETPLPLTMRSDLREGGRGPLGTDGGGRAEEAETHVTTTPLRHAKTPLSRPRRPREGHSPASRVLDARGAVRCTVPDMAALPQIATVHPHTITRHSQGAEFFSVPRRNHLRLAHSVTTFRVDPRVWEVALNAANGDARRIEIHSATSVTVHNSRQS